MFKLVPHAVVWNSINTRGLETPQMAQSRITSIEELCSRLNIPACDLLLPCFLCKKFLDPADRQNFSAGGFSLVWKDTGVYGLCARCAVASAALERTLHCKGNITADDYRDTYGEAVFCVRVRCLLCLHLLTVQEIDCMVERQQLFWIVRDQLRGLCGGCNT